jgi:hypothetical protein
MWTNGNRRKDELDDEKLNRFGNELLRAFEAGDAEVSTAAASPFLYRRIRVRIEAEELRLARQRSAWMSLLIGVKHAIPAPLVFAVIALASLMLTPSLSQQWPAPGVINDEPPTLMQDVFSFSQDELIASAAGVEPEQARNGGGMK